MDNIPHESVGESLLNPEVNLKFPKVRISQVTDTENFLNTRVELNDQIGMVKYVGKLKHKEDPSLWVGVEWEDPSRGKHNGTVEGVEYFKTTNNLPSGSLIRLNKINIGSTFEQAINFKYNFYNSKGNDIHQLLDRALETDNFIKANKKIINIELVGKEKAVKEFSSYSKMVCIDLTNCYIKELGNDIHTMLPKLRELMLTRTLLTKWSHLIDLLEQFPLLTMLNFSENILRFDDDFDNKIKPFETKEKKLYLETLVLNKCKIDFYGLIKLSPIFLSLNKLYLMGNDLNQESYNSSPNKEYIDKNLNALPTNTPNLTYISVERNKIKNFMFIYKMIPSQNLKYINMNQNHLVDLLNPDDKEEQALIPQFIKTVKNISIDYNMFPETVFTKVVQDIELLGFRDIDILNNSFIDKNGIEKAKIELIGRNPNLEVLNNTTITKILRRDYEKLYLKQSVSSYIDLPRKEKVTQENFNMKDFEDYMNKNHKQYFVLRKKYFDPLDEFINLLQKKSNNTIMANVVEVLLVYEKGQKEKKKKFPKTTTIGNLRNLCMKLFSMDCNETFSFHVKTEDKTELIEDETNTLQSLGFSSNNHTLILK